MNCLYNSAIEAKSPAGAQMGRTGILALFGAVALASPAVAGWDYAEWGMTPAQVVAAGKGAARLATEEELKKEREDFERATRMPGQPPPKMELSHRVKATRRIANFEFAVNFDFDSGNKLVYIQAANKTCDGAAGDQVEAALQAQYGLPTVKKFMGKRVIREAWEDRAHDNRVEWMNLNLMRSCYVSFRPFAPKR